MKVPGSPERLAHLDGLRGVAVLFVIFFHYFERWAEHYPYGVLLVHEPLKLTAWIGVWLFFVISGFVITLTLHRCATLFEFAVRRFARLWPAMLLCSALTYLALHLIPGSTFPVAAWNFAPSLTFTSPYLFNAATASRNFGWMDGAYWSLFVEVQFYAVIGLVFFVDRAHFKRNLILVSGFILLLYYADILVPIPKLDTILTVMDLPSYLPLFLIGVGFYEKHAGASGRPFFFLATAGIGAQVLIADRAHAGPILLAVASVLALALLGMRTTIGRRIGSARWLTRVGAASYSLYLLHQMVGVALIHWLGTMTSLRGVTSLWIPVAVAVLMILVASGVFKWWEAPLNRRIVQVMGSSRRPPRSNTVLGGRRVADDAGPIAKVAGGPCP
jgi:peptidoglycan/LPS O-acetylase OafA/YrhL